MTTNITAQIHHTPRKFCFTMTTSTGQVVRRLSVRELREIAAENSWTVL